jgi:chloramphenicol-sensitive protein RarD
MKSQATEVSVQPPERAANPARAGLVCGVTAYTMWGFFPIYFRWLAHVSPWTVLCHRVVWSVVLLSLVVTWRREWSQVLPIVRSPRNLALLSVGGVLIAINWLVFIYAVGSGQTLQSSLGYFINPLFSVALGMFFLHERLRPWQWLAVIVAICAVVNLAVRGAGFPWIALSLAGSFGLYGLVRKKVDINSLHALLIETAVLFPVAALVLLVVPTATFSTSTWGLLSILGVLTATPLLFFGAALRRLKLSTIGFLQYIGPTLQFMVAVLLFNEALDTTKLGSFVLCWIAIGIYVADSIWGHRTMGVADRPE